MDIFDSLQNLSFHNLTLGGSTLTNFGLNSTYTLCTCSHILYFFYETAAWNHFTLYMHIILGGLFNICEKGGLHAPP